MPSDVLCGRSGSGESYRLSIGLQVSLRAGVLGISQDRAECVLPHIKTIHVMTWLVPAAIIWSIGRAAFRAACTFFFSLLAGVHVGHVPRRAAEYGYGEMAMERFAGEDRHNGVR
jgi:hypothetical protein